MSSHHPFQKLCHAAATPDLPEALLTASGPQICCYDLDKGLTTRWPPVEEGNDIPDSEAPQADGDDDGGRPAKRQRLSGHEEPPLPRQDSEDSIEIISERIKGRRRKPKPVAEAKLPHVSHMLATENGRHIVVVTTDDKCIRVLERRKNDSFRGISERCMPKRLCAIALTKDEKTIVAGDKFGDVYSLPLFPTEDFSHPTPTSGQQESIPDFKPSASELTVHTKGNLEALRQQQQQQKKFKPKKEGPDFQHKLLLGHVSLLTDLAVVEVESVHSKRQYILTADRDEHIRISRGITQAHVIENYCLGHKDFVSKLCILPWQPKILVAGSGDPSLRVYDWQRGAFSTDLLSPGGALGEIAGFIMKSGQERSTERLAVSGIWPMSTSASQGYILVAFEGIPLVLSYFHGGAAFTQAQTLEVPGNVLDIAVFKGRHKIIVSIDTVHKAYSMKDRRESPLGQHEGILCFEIREETHAIATSTDAVQRQQLGEHILWQASDYLHAVEQALMDEPVESSVDAKESLYGLENLRKQRGQEAVEADEETTAAANGNADVEGEDGHD